VKIDFFLFEHRIKTKVQRIENKSEKMPDGQMSKTYGSYGKIETEP